MGQFISKFELLPDLFDITLSAGVAYVRNSTNDGWAAKTVIVKEAGDVDFEDSDLLNVGRMIFDGSSFRSGLGDAQFDADSSLSLSGGVNTVAINGSGVLVTADSTTPTPLEVTHSGNTVVELDTSGSPHTVLRVKPLDPSAGSGARGFFEAYDGGGTSYMFRVAFGHLNIGRSAAPFRIFGGATNSGMLDIGGTVQVGATLDVEGNPLIGLSSLEGEAAAPVDLTDGATSPADIEVTSDLVGLVLRSPDGTRWRVQVDNTGSLTTTAI